MLLNSIQTNIIIHNRKVQKVKNIALSVYQRTQF